MGPRYRPGSFGRRSASEEPAAGNAAPRAHFPILAKLLFTADQLSVQVHPDDDYALTHEGGPGKTEAWYVAAAEPGARIALGLKEDLSSDQLRHAAETGEIIKHLNWIEVRPGDAFFVPPGTVHALGPGLVICEVQQNSDLTYRLYDYGRAGADGKPRLLHLDQAVAVARIDSHPVAASPVAFSQSRAYAKRELLAACRYFAIERITWERPAGYNLAGDNAELLIVLDGRGQIRSTEDGSADSPSSDDRTPSGWSEAFAPGDAFLLPCELADFDVRPEAGTVAIRGYVPDLQELEAALRQSGATEDRIGTLLG